ncbi:hypothetical protein BWZ20_12885 [Winogradskyella sp. J14-2]|nr:hypothetical protein BWZ20_12885 [Winogradskyella sp. J14-2]
MGIGQSISEVEYFFNTDPGLGNATTLSVNGNSGELTQTFTIAVPTDAVGFNTLYVRAKDNTNIWSLYDNRLFYITDTSMGQNATEITAAEYFINSDPGFGNATALTVNPNTGNITENYAIPIGTDLNGFNTLYIRAQDNLGTWCLYDAVKFYVTEELGGGAASITEIEYFIDTDPGFGNATSINVESNSGSTTQNIVIPIGTLNEGFHNLYLRTQDDLGEWSLYDKRLFFVTPQQEVSPIIAAEYFYDTDPGFGNGTSVPLNPTGNMDEFTVDLSTVDLTCDLHDFYIRLINEDGSWSLYDYGLQIDVFDNANPTIVVFDNITVELDANGEGNLTVANVNNGTFDDCELVSVELNQTQFNYTCDDLGENTVTITATDAEGKVSTEDVIITVVDNIYPVAIAQNITVQLDASGNALVEANDLENGSTDNCGIASIDIDTNSFDCSNLGTNTVNFTVTDLDGNTNSTTATITVEDNIDPIALAQNITLALDTDGTASLTPDDIDLSTDNCSIVSRTLSITNFDCTNLGENTITLTVADESGNSAMTTAIVTITDTTNPIAVAQDVTVQLNSIGEASITAEDIENGSSDNCSIVNRTIDLNAFTCDDIGDNDVFFTVTDQNGNSDSVTVTVTVIDTETPTVIAQNISAPLDSNGLVTIDALDIDNGSSDNCLLDISIDNTTFSCEDLGDNTVILTAIDDSGNSNSTPAIVTVIDNLSPIALGQDITVDLAGQPSVMITAADLDNGSNDNCTFSLSLNQDTFTLPGDYAVDLTIEDSSGNTDIITLIVTVIDTTLSSNDFETDENVIRLYPNPVQSLLFIESEHEISELHIFDITGKTVTKKVKPSTHVDVSSISEGVYFITLYVNNTQVTKRFIKQ